MTITKFEDNKNAKKTNTMKKNINFAKYIVSEADRLEAKARIRELKAYVKDAIDSGKRNVIVKLPRYFFRIDPAYQTPVRTERDLGYLFGNFDDDKLLPLQGVIHWELGLVFLFDGYGRLVVTDMLNEERGDGKYDYLEVMIPLTAPDEPNARQRYEAEMYATQNTAVAKMTPLQKHGALRIMKDPTILKMDILEKKYEFTYASTRGQRDANIIGSYMEFYRSISRLGIEFGDYFFSLCKDARMNDKVNGYSVYIMRAVRDMYKMYPDYRKEIYNFLGNYMRERTVAVIKADGVSSYPMLDQIMAVSMHMEDLVTEYLGINKLRDIKDGKVINL